MDADAWNERYSGTDLLWTAEANRFVVTELDGVAPGRGLDLACGEGRNAVWLAGQGWTMTGVDFSAVALDKARRLADHHGVEVEWVEADVTDFRRELHSEDLVLIAYLHLPEDDRRAVWRHAAEAVAPGGTFLLVGHDRSNLDGGYGGPQDAAVLPTPDEVVAELDDLVVEKAEVVERPVETEDGLRVALDTLVRARRPG